MTTMTWMASKSTDSREREERKKCVSDAYRSQTGSGVRANNVDVNVQVSLEVIFNFIHI